jgi:hypothetical protein
MADAVEVERELELAVDAAGAERRNEADGGSRRVAAAARLGSSVSALASV